MVGGVGERVRGEEAPDEGEDENGWGRTEGVRFSGASLDLSPHPSISRSSFVSLFQLSNARYAAASKFVWPTKA